MLKRDHNSQQHDDRDKVASTPPPHSSAGIGMTNTAVSLSTVDPCHILHLPSLNTIICFTFGKNQTMHRAVKQSLVSPLFPFLLLTRNLYVDSFAQLPLCRLSIMSNRSGQRRWRLATEVVPVGYRPLFCCSLDQCD